VRSLNLASRPFRNERLPTLLVLASLAAVLLITTYHVFLIRDVMPDRTSALTLKLGEMEAESGRLRAEAADSRVDGPDKATLARWTQLKDLVDRRVFSWSGLFSVLEDTVPSGVRLVSLSPAVKKGQVTLRISVLARTFEEALAFMRALEERPEFEEVWPTSRGSTEAGLDYQYEMVYLPQPRKAGASPAPSPAPAASVEPGGTPGAVASARSMGGTP
jgi:Tfp pilus assembly protein PilN